MSEMILDIRHVSYSPIGLNVEQLQDIPAVLIATGTDCTGSSINQFDDNKIIKFRNIQNRAILALYNAHASLEANVRIKTAATLSGLDFEDLKVNLKPNTGIQLVGGFTSIFHTRGSIIEEIFGEPTERFYNDFIEFNVSHDAVDAEFKAGLIYV